VEASSGKVVLGKTERGGSKRGSREEMRGKRKEKAEERKNSRG